MHYFGQQVDWQSRFWGLWCPSVVRQQLYRAS